MCTHFLLEFCERSCQVPFTQCLLFATRNFRKKKKVRFGTRELKISKETIKWLWMSQIYPFFIIFGVLTSIQGDCSKEIKRSLLTISVRSADSNSWNFPSAFNNHATSKTIIDNKLFWAAVTFSKTYQKRSKKSS